MNELIKGIKHKYYIHTLRKIMEEQQNGKITVEEAFEKGNLLGIKVINTIPNGCKLIDLLYYESVIKFVNVHLFESTYRELSERFDGIEYTHGDEKVGKELFDTLARADNKMIKTYLRNTFVIFCALEDVREHV